MQTLLLLTALVVNSKLPAKENTQENVSLNILMKYTVITTFNQEGYNVYGRRMIDTFLTSWPVDVELRVYAEGFKIDSLATNMRVFDLAESSPALVAFKNKWQGVPKANGNPFPGAEKKAFKWQAVRFSHKVYAIFHAAATANTEWLIWMDGDMVCHGAIDHAQLDKFFPSTVDLCFAGRAKKFTECGLYGMHLTSPRIREWLAEFQRMYDDADNGIFTLEEWHDSFVFDAVRARVPVQELNWSAGLITGEGHPLINCEWGAYIDHLKGSRKNQGRSLSRDLLVQRTEKYWR